MELSWSRLKDGFRNSPNDIEVFEKDNEYHSDSFLDTVVNNASLILVNKYLRILCSGETEYENILLFNSKFKWIIGENKHVVAYDVFGGLFAITENVISYYSPDALNWENLGISYEGFVLWVSTRNTNEFYESFIWEDFDTFVKNVKIDEGIIMYPFLWAKECDVNTSSKRILPYDELLETNNGFYIEKKRDDDSEKC